MRLSRFARFAWIYLGLTLVVIVWGGVVRATGSGAGCGTDWPTCQGEIIPSMESWHTVVEYSHRLSTAVLGLLTVVLVIWAFRAFPRGHAVRLGAVLTGFFILAEAAVGAGLVLLEQVAYNVSIGRAYWMAGHLLNTLLLMASVTLLAWWASGGERVQVRHQGIVWLTILPAVLGMFVVGASGAVAALGDTLLDGFNIVKDEPQLMQALTAAGVSPTESAIVTAFVDLRIYHPVIAVVTGLLVVWAAWTARTQRSSALTRRFSTWLIALFVAQLLLGALNVWLKAPVWLQMVHLAMTNIIFVALVLLAAEALSLRLAPGAKSSPLPARRAGSAA